MEEENKKPFDFKRFEQEAIEKLQQGKPLEGKDGVLAPLIKRLVEAGLNTEIDAHLHGSKRSNRRNGKMGKQVKTAFGNVEIHTPRDRNSSFEPQLLPKRQTTLGQESRASFCDGRNRVLTCDAAQWQYSDSGHPRRRPIHHQRVERRHWL